MQQSRGIDHDIGAADKPGRRTVWAAVVIALMLAAAVFIIRGPVRAMSSGDDFILVYAPARAWLTGGDPFDSAAVDQAWVDGGGPFEERPSLTRRDGALIYPPTTLAVFTPFAALPWKIAQPMWVLANVVLLGVAVWSIAGLAGFRVDQRRAWLFVIAALMFMPVHTTLRHSQTPLLVLALLAAGYWVEKRRQRSEVRGQKSEEGGTSAITGLLLGLAAIIKPQISVPFLALQLLRRQWASLAVAGGLAAVLAALAILPLELRGISWWANWQANLARFTAGSVGDPTPANPARHQLLNLHYPLHAFIENRQIVTALVLLITGGLATAFFRSWILDFGFWIRGLKRGPDSAIQNPKSKIQNSPGLLLPLSMVAVLSLMIVYHRFYDGVLLLLPLAWAIGAVAERRSNRAAWCVLALMVPFFLNSAAALFNFERMGWLPAWLTDQWWWDNLLMPHQAWALLLMAICLAWAGEGKRRRAA